MRTDALPRKILVGDNLIGQIQAISCGNQPLREHAEPERQRPEIRIRGNSARFIVVAITEMLHATFQLCAPHTRIQPVGDGGLLFWREKTVKIDNAGR